MYDAIVIGGGPAGYVAAVRLASYGFKVALVERRYLGGECTNWGCIPSKALIEIAHGLSIAKQLRRVGINIGISEVNRSKILEWIKRVVLRSREGIKYLVSDVDLYEGEASLKRRNEVIVRRREGREVIEGKNIIIATGTEPSEIPGVRFDGEYVLSNRNFFELKEIPSSILIVGGGIIGVELGSALARLSTEVYIVEILDRIISIYDPDVSSIIMKYLKRFGVKVYLRSTVKRVEVSGGVVRARIVSRDGESMDVSVEKVLIAVGRKYNTKGIGLENVGVKTHEKGYIIVDERQKTNVGNIYAAGDVTGPPLLAHKAYREAIIAADVIAGAEEVPPKEPIPEVIYTTPEVGVVGITELKAKEAKINVQIVKYPYAAVPRDYTVLERTPEGFIKLIVEGSTKRIIGGVIVGNMASELIHVLALAIQKRLTLKDLSEVIYAHPTYSEMIGEVAHLGLGKPIHIKGQHT